jgi:hypothetical protein
LTPGISDPSLAETTLPDTVIFCDLAEMTPNKSIPPSKNFFMHYVCVNIDVSRPASLVQPALQYKLPDIFSRGSGIQITVNSVKVHSFKIKDLTLNCKGGFIPKRKFRCFSIN